jgi:hypothetical protein
MPTAPRPITKCMQLFYSAPAFAQKIEPLPAKPPCDSNRLQNLIGKSNKAILPAGRANANRIRFVAPLPPVTLGLADVARASERANLESDPALCPVKADSAAQRSAE